MFYTMYEHEFNEETSTSSKISAEQFPSREQLELPQAGKMKFPGYELVGFFNAFACSPLSCNGLASEIPCNAHCLFSSMEELIARLDGGLLVNAEPGPYRIFGVYRIFN